MERLGPMLLPSVQVLGAIRETDGYPRYSATKSVDFSEAGPFGGPVKDPEALKPTSIQNPKALRTLTEAEEVRERDTWTS